MKMERFLRTLPEFLRGLQALHCEILTYRQMVGYGDGPVALTSPGLSVHVCSGPGQSLMTMRSVVLSRDVEPADKEARRHLDEAWSRVPVLDKGVPLLFVAYAGAHAFEEALAYLKIVRRGHPSAMVVAIACDCLWPLKWHSLEPLLADGTISYVVKTERCGASAELLQIVETVISGWDVRNQV